LSAFIGSASSRVRTTITPTMEQISPSAMMTSGKRMPLMPND
jgi:hypothetical protein